MASPRVLFAQVGQRFGKGVVIDPEARVRRGKRTARAARLRCDCGNEYSVPLYQLVRGDRESCGCQARRERREQAIKRTEKHCPCPDHEGPNPVPVSEFGKHKGRAVDGLTAWCRPCMNRARRQWAETDPDKARELARGYREANLDHARARSLENHVACQNSSRASDLGFYSRRSCSSASSICSWSGCSAGWRSSRTATPPRKWRSWCCGTRSRSFAAKSPARTGLGRPRHDRRLDAAAAPARAAAPDRDARHPARLAHAGRGATGGVQEGAGACTEGWEEGSGLGRERRARGCGRE
jgi:hypothetical protein